RALADLHRPGREGDRVGKRRSGEEVRRLEPGVAAGTAALADADPRRPRGDVARSESVDGAPEKRDDPLGERTPGELELAETGGIERVVGAVRGAVEVEREERFPGAVRRAERRPESALG